MHSSTISTILTLLLTYLTFSLPGFAQSTPLSGPRDTTVTSTSAETAQAVGAPCDTFGSYACANIDNTGSIVRIFRSGALTHLLSHLSTRLHLYQNY